VRSDGGALCVSTAGSLALSLLLPLFALSSKLWQFCAVGALYGVAGTAQLAPTSALLELAVRTDGWLAEQPSLVYALFNCAYVTGMAIGPSALALLVDGCGFVRAALILATASATVATAVALALRRELELGDCRSRAATPSQPEALLAGSGGLAEGLLAKTGRSRSGPALFGLGEDESAAGAAADGGGARAEPSDLCAAERAARLGGTAPCDEAEEGAWFGGWDSQECSEPARPHSTLPPARRAAALHPAPPVADRPRARGSSVAGCG
jgi:hypothetical protein